MRDCQPHIVTLQGEFASTVFPSWQWLLQCIQLPLMIKLLLLASCLTSLLPIPILTMLLGCTEVSLIMHLSFPDCLLSFPFVVWVRMTLPMCFCFDVGVWVRIAPYIIRTSLFHLNKLWPQPSSVDICSTNSIAYISYPRPLSTSTNWSQISPHLDLPAAHQPHHQHHILASHSLPFPYLLANSTSNCSTTS